MDDELDDQLDDVEWEEVFFDGELFVSDQRQKERHEASVQVAYAHDSTRFRSNSVDLSRGGLFLGAEELLPIDSEFKLVFKLPNREEPLRAVARVAWVREEPGEAEDEPRGFGVEFIKISRQDRAAIEEFLELQSALLAEPDD